jgi:hypothetical protein
MLILSTYIYIYIYIYILPQKVQLNIKYKILVDKNVAYIRVRI